MSTTFPTLKTGATAQYPASKSISYSSFVVRFLDGSDQRCRTYSAPLHKWALPYTLLDDTEVSTQEQFFAAQEGQAGTFSFTDLWTQTPYPNCSLARDNFSSELKQEAQVTTAALVTENRT